MCVPHALNTNGGLKVETLEYNLVCIARSK